MSFLQIMQLAVGLLVGLMAGLMYAYQCSVIGGLGKLADRDYLMAFQSINKAILNPWFFASFLGCLVVLPVACWLQYHAGAYTSFYFLLAAVIIYFIGVFGMTMLGNVPLNEVLADYNLLNASVEELHELRKLFESSWNKYHIIRTVAAVISFLFTLLSFLQFK